MESSSAAEINHLDFIRSNLKTIWTQYLNPSIGPVELLDVHVRECIQSTLSLLKESPNLFTDSNEFSCQLIQSLIRFLTLPLSNELLHLVNEILCLCIWYLAQGNNGFTADSVLFGIQCFLDELASSFPSTSTNPIELELTIFDKKHQKSETIMIFIDSLISAKRFKNHLESVIEECRPYLIYFFPWFWDALSSSSGSSNDCCYALYSTSADVSKDTKCHSESILELEKQLLNASCPSDECELILETYVLKLEQEPLIISNGFFEISLKFANIYPEVIYDLLLISFQRAPPSATPSNVIISHPSTEHLSQCVLQISYSLSDEQASQFPFNFLPWLVAAFVCSGHLLNIVPTLIYLINHFDCDLVMKIFVVIAPFVQENASLLLLIISIHILHHLDEALVAPIAPWLSQVKSDFSFPPLSPTPASYSLAKKCILCLSDLNLDLPNEVSLWIHALKPSLPSHTDQLQELCEQFSLDFISDFRRILLLEGHSQMKKRMHPFWNTLILQILNWKDDHEKAQAFQFLALLIDFSLDSFVMSLKTILIPLALTSPWLASFLSSVLGNSFETIAMTYSETWISWVILNETSSQWSLKLSDVATSVFAQPNRGILDICESGGYPLIVQLCLHHEFQGLGWLASILKKSLLSLILDAALPLLMLLGDSIQRIPWSPGHPDPQTALATLAWFISQLNTDVAMIASQVLALLSSVAGEYPEHVSECWKIFIQSIDHDSLIHFWPSILMASITKMTDSSCQYKFLDFLFTTCPKKLLPLLPDLPPPYTEYQKLIDAAKSTFSFEARIHQICTRISSTDLEVASASLDELKHTLAKSDTILETHRILESLLLVLKRHPSLKLKCADCLCTLGAIDTLTTPLDLPSSETLCESTSLPQKLVEECLLPSFRSSTNLVSQIFFAFTIQKICKLAPGMIHDLNELDSATIRPLLKSTYRLALQEPLSFTFPIFAPSMRLDDWVCRFVFLLSEYCLQDPLKSILQAIQPLLSRPAEARSLALFILPHVILQICLYQRDQLSLVSDEFNNVLRQTEADRSTYPCAHTIFSILSHLMGWLYQNKGSRRQSEPVQAFLKSIQLKYLAEAAEKIGLYDTSLFYLESMSSPPFKLFEIYVKKGEMDYALGISTLNGFKTPEHIALEHAISNDWALVQAVYSSSLALDLSSLPKQMELLNAMKELDLFSSVLPHCNGLISDFPNCTEKVNSFRIEACWQLGQWEKLDSYLNETSDSAQLGHLFHALYQKNSDLFLSSCKTLKLTLLDQFQINQSTATLVEFHAIEDLITYHDCMDESWIVSGYPIWQSRIKRVRNTHGCKERILKVCRSINLLQPQPSPQWTSLMGSLSLQSAKLSMKDNRKYTAYSHLLNAQHYYQTLPVYYHVQMGKWLAQYQNVQAALGYVKPFSSAKATLPSNILNIVKVCYNQHLQPGTDEFELSHLQLLSARWMDITNDSDPDTILKAYHSACTNQPSWEKPVYFMGRYTHKLLTEEKLQSKENPNMDRLRLTEQAIKLYGRCLLLGTRYSYEAMPLLLNLWMDSAPDYSSSSTNQPSSSMQRYILQLLIELPVYSLLVALPQVTSRLCHKNKDVLSALTLFIVRCLNSCPSQSMWHFISSVHSADPLRAKRAKDIIQVAKSNSPEIATCLSQIQMLSELLIHVCNLSVPKEQTHFSLSSKCPQLSKLTHLDRVVLPMQAFLHCTLPKAHSPSTKDSIISDGQVYFHSFSDRVEIMSSLVRPKKLEATGSDGVTYTFLCKPKDDLRKDARLLEFSAFLNRLLVKKRTCRERNLRIRTYSVTPLSEECGIIEWIPRTCAMRAILRPMYISRNMDIFNREIQQMFRDPPEKLQTNFLMLLKKCPPLLHFWFAQSFPGPRAWFQARLNFTRTCAVMSMVGYILGLGDRHCENILLDIDSGDLIHVDFNCLFEKGKTLAKPEIVPFRLTQNLVAAFGTGGLEGPFRKACEVTLELLRANSESLMIVLESFLHDPLIEWKSKKKAQADFSEDQMRNQAKLILKKIEERLQGIVEHGSPLSIPGQVSELIRQATSSEALSRMYEGWLPHI